MLTELPTIAEQVNRSQPREPSTDNPHKGNAAATNGIARQ